MSPLQRLSGREIQVLRLVVEGRTSKEIARTRRRTSTSAIG